MTPRIIMYGATHCEDTRRTRRYLQTRGIAFEDVNIDHDPEAERFVVYIHAGARRTPTLVIGDQRRLIVAEPSDAEMDEILATYS